MPKILEAKNADIALLNPHWDRAIKILKSKKWKSVEFPKPLGGQISFCPEIDSDPDNPKDWLLHILFVPELGEPDHHHLIFGLKDIRKIQKFLNKLTGHIEGLKAKKLRKRKLRPNKKKSLRKKK